MIDTERKQGYILKFDKTGWGTHYFILLGLEIWPNLKIFLKQLVLKTMIELVLASDSDVKERLNCIEMSEEPKI